MQALVLVGGEGTRLRPLADTMPKPVLPLVDRRLLAFMVDWLDRHGVEEIVFASGFMSDTLREALGEGNAGGPRLRYLAEPAPLGTAGAIKFAAEQLGERFLALNGDVLADLDLTALVRAHEDSGATATLGLYRVDDPAAYGLVRRGEAGEVLEFVEKPGSGEGGGEINAGTYVLERSVLGLVPAGREVSIEREVFPRLVGRGLHGLALEGYWMDIGTPERYLQATWDILEGRVETDAEQSPDAVRVAPSAEVAATAAVGPRAVVAERCRIGERAEVRGSVLLAGCTIGAGVAVEDSILGPGAEVEDGLALRGAVVGEGERVRA